MAERAIEVELQRAEGELRLTIRGVLTETAPLAALLTKEDWPARVVIDTAELRALNSCGVREWINFIAALGERSEVILERCSPALVRQLGMIKSCLGQARVRSVMLPLICDQCDEERLVELNVEDGVPIDLPEEICDGEPMDLDDDPERFFAFTRLPGALLGQADDGSSR